ncbi:LOW QUALITY PROTEIN: reverse transcriptase [Phytophthora megakarya]|uniref:Reverse transcriptase n=1 Tax=Phytophthora megakarya TaxID=4795 RepID=A0A225WLR1_9STRA|nr:LOW QUALITY PROTEIN: reverse transcriptase [Phytophthora megakarya]
MCKFWINDEYAQRHTLEINTTRNRFRGETPFDMVHGWDARTTLEAVTSVGSTCRYLRDPRRWRYQTQKYYQQPRKQFNQHPRIAIADSADTHIVLMRPFTAETEARG